MSEEISYGRGQNPNSQKNLKSLKPGESGHDLPRNPNKEPRDRRRISAPRAFNEAGVDPFKTQAAIISNDVKKLKEVGIEFNPIYKKDDAGNPTEEIIRWEQKGPIKLDVILQVANQAAQYLAPKKGTTKVAAPIENKPPKEGLPEPEKDTTVVVID
ncbi:MAG: hypothetical protein ACTSQA_08735 [Candidatus Heimdallarchaeaceae archaeon]